MDVVKITRAEIVVVCVPAPVIESLMRMASVI